MASARPRLPKKLNGLLTSEWERILSEAGFSRQDEEIVREYIIAKNPQADVAGGFFCDRSSISRRLPKIYERAQQVAEKLNM